MKSPTNSPTKYLAVNCLVANQDPTKKFGRRLTPTEQRSLTGRRSGRKLVGLSQFPTKERPINSVGAILRLTCTPFRSEKCLPDQTCTRFCVRFRPISDRFFSRTAHFRPKCTRIRSENCGHWKIKTRPAAN